jgi:glyoxylase-like metal-dependent hydrolase (beta-lactamase superfamily II)
LQPRFAVGSVEEDPVHHHSRRGFLARTLGAAWFGASLLERATLRAAQARAQSKQALPQLFDIEKAADGVYAAIARGRAILNCNAVIFENSNGLLIVDAHACPSAVFSLVAQIRREITTKPVRYVVTTHMHGDHTQGLPAYKRIAPAADIISSVKTGELLKELGPARLKAAIDAVPGSIEAFRSRLATAKTPEEKAYFQEMIAQTRAFLAEMRDVTVELPTLTFEDRLVLRDKAHDLHLSFRGRGHTAGDIVVFCPQKKVIASGDLLHSFFPNIGDGYPKDWPATLRSMSELPFETVVGGHGGVLHSSERLGQLRAYMEELVELVGHAKQQGMPLDRLLETMTPASLKTLETGGYGDYLVSQTKLHDFRVHLSTPSEVMIRGLRDNVSAVFHNFDRA